MAKAFGIGLAGAATCLLLWHLWIDHQALHAIIDMVNRNAAQQAPQQPAGAKP